MIVDKIDISRVATLKPKDDAPVPTDGYAPKAFEIAGQGMKAESRDGHVLSGLGRVQAGEDAFDLVDIGRGQSPFVAVFEQAFQSAMAKADDHEYL